MSPPPIRTVPDRRPCRRPAPAEPRREGLDPRPRLLLRRQRALKNITLPLYENKVTAFIGPSGCGKSTLLRVLNRMYDLYPGQRAEGEVLLDGEDILSPQAGPQPAARPHRHGVPEADAVPDDDLREHRLRHPALRALSRAEMDEPGRAGAARARRCGTRSRTSSTPTA